MNNITIRDVTPADIPAIKEVVREVWDWEGAFNDDAVIEACVAIYFAPVLHEVTFGRVALLDGKVVGVIFGVVDGETPSYKHLSEDLSPYIITLMQACDEDRHSMCEYMTKQRIVYAELIDGIEDEYDGAVDFLVLSKAAQGKGIGKQLWLSLKEYLQEKNATKVYLYSDSECNFGFYDSQGFVKRREGEMRVVFNGEEDVTGQFLYEYEF